MRPRRAIPPPAACQPAKQRTTSPRYRPDATRYGVAPIVNRLFRGVALRKRAELLMRNEETENLLREVCRLPTGETADCQSALQAERAALRRSADC